MNDIYSHNEIFKTYFERAPEKTWVVDSCNDRLHFSDNKAMILDAGCYDGQLIQRITDQYRDVLPSQTTIIGIDPCATAIDTFNKTDFGDKITAHGRAVTLEDFLDENTIKFDWVIASQSLYWTKDLKKVIQQIADMSHQALLVLRGQVGIYQIQKAFPELVGHHQEQFYNAEDIQDALTELQINFTREDKSTYFPLPERGTPEYHYLLNFFLQTPHGSLTPTDETRVYEFLTLTFPIKSATM